MSITVPPLQGVAVAYKSTLNSVVSFANGADYGRDKQYKKGELRELTRNDVVRWMLVKTYGIPDPPIDLNPKFVRSSTLAFWKKTISYFMPDHLVSLVSGRNEGNPTRNTDVNNLIRRVNKKEVRKQGVLS